MTSFPLHTVSQQNVVQILRKMNDLSFARSVQTSRRLFHLSQLMNKKVGKIYCHAYLPIFVYFDREEQRIMFDVPYNARKAKDFWLPIAREDSFSSAYTVPSPQGAALSSDVDSDGDDDEDYPPDSPSDSDGEEVEAMETEQQEEEHEPKNCRKIGKCQQEACQVVLAESAFILDEKESDSRSHLCFCLSNRQRPFYRGVTAAELGEWLEFFRFRMLSIDPYQNEEHPLGPAVAQGAAAELLSLFPKIRCETLEIVGNNLPAGQFDLLLSTGRQFLGFKRLYIHNSELHGKVAGIFTPDILALEQFEARIETRIEKTVLRNFIQRWKDGQTGLKHIRLEVEDDPAAPTQFDAIGIGLLPFVEMEERPFYLARSPPPGSPRLGIFVNSYMNTKFYDVTDCDGCDCGSSFCFKQLVEVLLENYSAYGWQSPVIDFGPIWEQWNGGDVVALGELVKAHLEG